MSDFFPSERPASANLHEFSVSELAGSIKRTIETNFDRVRVRGELGRVTIAKSGHMYADLKDDKAVINTIMWKGSVSNLPFRPEEGLEVVAEGKLSTYPGRSNYQLIADTMSPAGAGALMALLEERKKKLAAEGLFDPARKRALPFLPRTIGVVTSPTGAVIRDILHRLEDRFPVHVLLWPVLVQGEKAAAQIEAGIKGFNALSVDGETPRPDVIIVARGGGSIEDLWPFNEEIVVRAAAASDKPLISAVGHETDTTLIDYASDKRAPTPTGAAEIAVPVRRDLLERISGLDQRLTQGVSQSLRRQERELTATAARLPRPESLIETRQQRFDYAEGRLTSALQTAILKKQNVFDQIGSRLRPQALSRGMEQMQASLDRAGQSLGKALLRSTEKHQTTLSSLSKRLETQRKMVSDLSGHENDIANLENRLQHAFERRLTQKQDALKTASNMLEALSYQATIKRGFTIVRDKQGKLIRSQSGAASEDEMVLTFADGDLAVSPVSENGKPAPKSKGAAKAPKGQQGSLF